jgi:DNA-binding GntR family transcriptional regulator
MSALIDIETKHLKDIHALEGSLAQRVYQALKDAILALKFPPGAVLRKDAICEALEVSRSPVSEAITRLAAEGLVDVVPQSATRVAYFSMDEIREGSFLREALELAVVAKVASDRSDEQLTNLSRNLRLQQLLLEDEDYAGFYKTDEEFHRLLMEFTGYTRLASLAHMVSLQVTRARMILLPSPGRAENTLAEHKEILSAIRAKDPAAAQAAMQRHLRQLMPHIEHLSHERPELFKTVQS